MRPILVALLICLFPVSSFSGFPYDRRSENIAVLFTMTSESGRIENLQMMESVLKDGKLGFSKVERHHNMSSPDIYEALTEAAKRVGKNGTLLAYFNSHGGGSGDRFGMSARGGSFKLSKALAAIAKGNKVKRLIVLIDTCHASGGIQEGFQGNEVPIDPRTGMREIGWGLSSFDAYEEALVIASSSAQDLSMRGAFASRLKRAYNQVGTKDITVSEFLRSFASLHSSTNQKPHYKVLPNDQMLGEPLFLNSLIREIPVVDHDDPQKKFPPDYIPTPRR